MRYVSLSYTYGNSSGKGAPPDSRQCSVVSSHKRCGEISAEAGVVVTGPCHQLPEETRSPWPLTAVNSKLRVRIPYQLLRSCWPPKHGQIFCCLCYLSLLCRLDVQRGNASPTRLRLASRHLVSRRTTGSRSLRVTRLLFTPTIKNGQAMEAETARSDRASVLDGDAPGVPNPELKLPQMTSLVIMLFSNVLLQVRRRCPTIVNVSLSNMLDVLLHHCLLVKRVCGPSRRRRDL